MGKEQILLYHLDKEKREAIGKVCLQLGIKVKYIPVEQYHLPIGILVMGKPAMGKKMTADSYRETEEILEEMMVMDGFSGARMDRFLERMKKARISGIELKAIITEYNKNWNSIQLYQELKAEWQKFQQRKDKNIE